MARFLGLLIATIALIGGGVLFYLLSVGGVLFGGQSPANDLGVYGVTVTMVMLGIGAWLLRTARIRNAPPQA
jgi:hypothetical protein